MSNEPLVSVFCFIRNAERRGNLMRASIESVLNQTYRNIEFVIQDGASTDQTVEIIKSYNDPRIKLVSEPDKGPEDGFWKALKRCQGDFIGSCLSDEVLYPDAIQVAVDTFLAEPHVGILCRDAINCFQGGGTDYVKGQVFTLLEYMSASFTPHFVASFFRKSAIEDVGLHTRNWKIHCGEFEFWCRLRLKHEMTYRPGVAANYAIHSEQMSRDAENAYTLFIERVEVLSDIFKENPEMFPDDVKQACKLSLGLHFADFLDKICGRRDLAEKIMSVCQQIMMGTYKK